jgi:hypothetical protein
VHRFRLSDANIGTPIHFGMEGTVTNIILGTNYALGSIGMWDDTTIGACSHSNSN